jgi:diacylglycerol kinase family enzyme
LTLSIDGRPVELEPPGNGTVIVANARQYAFGLDPAPEADMTDGRLDVIYLPVATRRSLLAWMARLRFSRRRDGPGVVVRQAASVEIGCDRPRRLQLDGDPPDGGLGRTSQVFRLSVRPGVLPVLVPPQT